MPSTTYRIAGSSGTLDIVVSNGGAKLTSSSLAREAVSFFDEDSEHDANLEYNGGVNGIEAYLVALAARGVDVSAPAFAQALDDAVDGMANALS